ncbi:AAA family ATPase, partial [Curtobacterium sp. BRB10]|uniref:AAA family ATPase n=1 Tax=Curtobacterium sp. BRB10 TaxID=2962579 RepID=UPI002881BC7C
RDSERGSRSSTVAVVLIVIRGASCSGKSTLAAQLQQELGWPAAVLGQDHFLRIIYSERQDAGHSDGMEHAAWPSQIRDTAEYPEVMNEFRTLTLVGGIIAAVGGPICVTAVIATFAGGFDGGANIGAGLLFLLGVPVAIVGGIFLLIAAIGSLARHGRRRPE